jgi:predicted nucleic acid-binding protein
MPAVVVDTNIVSYIFKRDTRAQAYHRHLAGQTVVISFMTLAELAAWALQYGWGQTRRSRLANYLRQYVVHHSDPALCERWAEARIQARRRGQPI